MTEQSTSTSDDSMTPHDYSSCARTNVTHADLVYHIVRHVSTGLRITLSAILYPVCVSTGLSPSLARSSLCGGVGAGGVCPPGAGVRRHHPGVAQLLRGRVSAGAPRGCSPRPVGVCAVPHALGVAEFHGRSDPRCEAHGAGLLVSLYRLGTQSDCNFSAGLLFGYYHSLLQTPPRRCERCERRERL